MSAGRAIPHPSPNHGVRRGGAGVDMVVLHYTGMATAAAALARLSDPAAEVSAHYLIDEAGCVFALVAEDRRAWHAGRARWGDVADVNSRSIGIELANPGEGSMAHPFPAPQMAALERLLAGLLARHGVPRERVVGHACVAPERKRDPGPRFDWLGLARLGLAVWPGLADAPGARRLPRPPTRRRRAPGAPRGTPDPAAADRFQAAAAAFGYPAGGSGAWDGPTCALWRAFAERFAPALAAHPGDPEGLALIEALAARWPVALDGFRAGA